MNEGGTVPCNPREGYLKKRVLLELFGLYLIGMAVFGFLWAGIARPGSFELLAIASLSTVYLGFSVLNYRRRILNGEKYPLSLRIFQLLYWILTIPLFFLLAPLHSLVRDFVERLASLLFLSFLYAPMDIFFRFFHAVKIRYREPESVDRSAE